MRIAVVDDESIWRDKALHIMKMYGIKAEKIDTYARGKEFLDAGENYDIVIMDLEMPEMDGFDTITEYRRNYSESIILILTTHTEFARKGYLVNAFRYIDKLKMEEELQEALERIEEIIRKRNFAITGYRENKACRIPVNDILFVETEGRKSKIHTCQGDFFVDYKITELEELLEVYGFFRSHKSFVINLNAVEKLDYDFAYFQNGEKAYVSARKSVETRRKYFDVKKSSAAM